MLLAITLLWQYSLIPNTVCHIHLFLIPLNSFASGISLPFGTRLCKSLIDQVIELLLRLAVCVLRMPDYSVWSFNKLRPSWSTHASVWSSIRLITVVRFFNILATAFDEAMVFVGSLAINRSPRSKSSPYSLHSLESVELSGTHGIWLPWLTRGRQVLLDSTLRIDVQTLQTFIRRLVQQNRYVESLQMLLRPLHILRCGRALQDVLQRVVAVLRQVAMMPLVQYRNRKSRPVVTAFLLEDRRSLRFKALRRVLRSRKRCWLV